MVYERTDKIDINGFVLLSDHCAILNNIFRGKDHQIRVEGYTYTV